MSKRQWVDNWPDLTSDEESHVMNIWLVIAIVGGSLAVTVAIAFGVLSWLGAL